jgi:hypothetical protein
METNGVRDEDESGKAESNNDRWHKHVQFSLSYRALVTGESG